VRVYAAIDREDIDVLVKETVDMVLDAFVGVHAAIDQEGDIAALVKETVDMMLDVLVVGFHWARRKD
jgi:hypothetical protein